MKKLDYTLIRSDRKTVAIQVKRDGSVILRAPRRMTKRDADRTVENNRDWIEKQQKKLSSLPPAPPEPSPDELKDLADRARAVLPERVAHFSEIMGLSPTGITITSARTRYGSCSPKNRLSFSCRLMLKPDAAIDYVVVHELAHIKHKNHSRDFYALVASILPDHKERRAMLR